MSSRIRYDDEALNELASRVDTVREGLSAGAVNGLSAPVPAQIMDALGEFEAQWGSLRRDLVEELGGLTEGVRRAAREFAEVDAQMSRLLRTLDL